MKVSIIIEKILFMITVLTMLAISCEADSTNNKLLQLTSSGEGNVYRRSLDGHFYVEAVIEGKVVIFLVDTGATKTILADSDAKRLGIATSPSQYIERYETPNGLISAAPVILDKVVIGGIELSGVRASISKMQIKQSILGMNILSQLNMSLLGNRMVITELHSNT